MAGAARGARADLAGKVGSLPLSQPNEDGLLYVIRALPDGRPDGGAPALARRAAPNSSCRRFTSCALTRAGGAALALVTDAGAVFVLQLDQHRRRYAQLDPLDGPAGAAAWAATAPGRRLLFVAPASGGVRAYDLASRAFATLTGNRARVRALAPRGGGEQLAAASADGVVLWDLNSMQRRRLLSATPYGTLQVGRGAEAAGAMCV